MNTTPTIDLFVFDGLADWEVGLTIAHLNHYDGQFLPGTFRVRTLGSTTRPVRTMGGMTVVPDATFQATDDAALLILPGGVGWDDPNEFDRFDAAVQRARSRLARNAPVAAICGATAGLARAGLLDDRRHTSNAREYLAATGYAGEDGYVDTDALTDGALVTAGSTAAVGFAREVFRALSAFDAATIDAWHGLFSSGEARYFGALMEAIHNAAGE